MKPVWIAVALSVLEMGSGACHPRESGHPTPERVAGSEAARERVKPPAPLTTETILALEVPLGRGFIQKAGVA